MADQPNEHIIRDLKQADKAGADAAYLRASDRFFTAASGTPPTDQQHTDHDKVRAAVVNLAAIIDHRVPDGRDKAIAMTALEDVLMRANRGIFTPSA